TWVVRVAADGSSADRALGITPAARRFTRRFLLRFFVSGEISGGEALVTRFSFVFYGDIFCDVRDVTTTWSGCDPLNVVSSAFVILVTALLLTPTFFFFFLLLVLSGPVLAIN
ncbi:hypothetical protein IscW_ISCW019675, partial [Ixodes scapularis]